MLSLLLSAFLLLFAFGSSALPILFSLFFIYLLRSLYSIKAIEAFCEFNYGITIVSGGLVAIILLLFYFFESDHTLKLTSVIVALAIANAIIYYWPQKKNVPASSEYDFYSFIRMVAKQTNDTRIIKVTFPLRLSGEKIKRMRRKLSALGPSSLIDDCSQWINLNENYIHQDILPILMDISGAYLYDFEDGGTHANGSAALKTLFVNNRSKQTLTSLYETFKNIFPNGKILNVTPGQSNIDQFHFTREEGSSLFFLARRFLYQPFFESKESNYFVTASTNDDGINTIFLTPKNNATKSKKREWNTILLSYLATLGIEKS